MNQNMGDYSEPWQGKEERDLESGNKSLNFMQRRKLWIVRFQHKILHSPMVPLIVRLIVLSLCISALGLGASVRHLSNKFSQPQGASPDMAIIVDAIAPVYLVYITYDEYTGKPLGLRPARAKMRLIFLDLIFIVFASANMALAFESISSVTGACMHAKINDFFDPKNDPICVRQKALASVLLVALIAWVMTFTISALRYVAMRVLRIPYASVNGYLQGRGTSHRKRINLPFTPFHLDIICLSTVFMHLQPHVVLFPRCLLLILLERGSHLFFFLGSFLFFLLFPTVFIYPLLYITNTLFAFSPVCPRTIVFRSWYSLYKIMGGVIYCFLSSHTFSLYIFNTNTHNFLS